jgi:pimeloyl-ACP methyl ester carboxylesterase
MQSLYYDAMTFGVFRHLGDTSELMIVKNAGHAINREKPAELCRLITNYIIDPSVKYRDSRKVPIHYDN